MKEIKRTLQALLQKNIKSQGKSILLLGPRQTGKSFLLKKMTPDLAINLSKESEYQQFLKDPSLIEKTVAPLFKKKSVVFIDEIQRLPWMMNTIQAVIDEHKNIVFLISGSSARKLRKKEVNLLPGRIFSYQLHPLSFWELRDEGLFDLKKCLSIGSLPEVYLYDYGPDLLVEYVDTYLREEIIAEALVRHIAGFSRFIDLAAHCSGQELNYSQMASDSEIPKETLRRYVEILSETLIIHRLPGYSKIQGTRKAIQKEKFIFFDLGVRNGILRQHKNTFSAEALGGLFEQWVILQVLCLKSYRKTNWEVYYYRDDKKTEVDLLIETAEKIYAIEIKWGEKFRSDWLKNLLSFQEQRPHKPVIPIVVYRGPRELQDQGISIQPYQQFLDFLLQVE